MEKASPLSQLCTALDAPCPALSSNQATEVFCKYMVWLLTSLQVQYRALHGVRHESTAEALKVYGKWDGGLQPTARDWDVAAQMMENLLPPADRGYTYPAFWAVEFQRTGDPGALDKLVAEADGRSRVSGPVAGDSTSLEGQRRRLDLLVGLYVKPTPLDDIRLDF
jgi:hypothetical protein